jgi:1,4-dihydroxy-2-naphthoyl-CoA synthase
MNHNPFHASAWRPVDGFADLTDITYHRHITDSTVRVAFSRQFPPNRINAGLNQATRWLPRVC